MIRRSGRPQTASSAALGRGEVIVPITEEDEFETDEEDQAILGNAVQRSNESPEFFFSKQAPLVSKQAPSTPSIINSPSATSPQASHESIWASYKKKRRAKIPSRSMDAKVVQSDPPTKLIEGFLQRQAASGNLCLDMDMDMMEQLPPNALSEEDAQGNTLLTGFNNASPSFSSNVVDQHASMSTRAPSIVHSSSNIGIKDEQPRGQRQVQHAASLKPTHDLSKSPAAILTSTSAKSSTNEDDYGSDSSVDNETPNRPKSVLFSLTRLQTRSRLSDPPTLPMQQGDSYKTTYKSSAQLRSGMIQRSGLVAKCDFEEEDDPLKDLDMPESFRKHRWSPLLLFQWVSFFLIMVALICSLTLPALKKRPLWSMALWKWALVVFLLFCGRLVSGWVIQILVAILEKNFLLRKRVLYFVYGLRKGVQNFLWFALAILAWRLVFDPKLEKTTNSMVLPLVTKLLHCLLIAAAIWLVKIFCVKVLASSFHVSTYFERIRESLFSQWVLETLAGPPLMEMEEEAKVIDEINDLRKAGAKIPDEMVPKARLYGGGGEGANVDSSTKGKGGNADKLAAKVRSMNVRSGVGGKSGMIGIGKSGIIGIGRSGMIGPAYNNAKSGMVAKSGMLRLKSQNNLSNMEKHRVPDQEMISIDDLHRLNKRNISAWNMKRLMNFVRYRGVYTLANVIDESAGAQDESQDVEIESEWQARNVARTIFKNVAKPNSRVIVREDLLRFMQDDAADKAMALFEGAIDSGKITKNALKDFAVHVVRERRALSLSLNDTKTAVKKLHSLVDVVVGVAIAIICMLVLGIATTHLLLVVSSQLVLVVFIFGNTCKTVFEAIVFLFIMHPFDVGDRCVVDSNQVIVEEMNILSTVFMRNDGEKLWYPNSVLATKLIFNYFRTPDTGDNFEFSIDCCTPTEKIYALKEKIAKYIASKPNYWARDFNLIVREIEDSNKMKMQLMVDHTINYSNALERQIRRSELILEVKKIMQDLELGYHLPVQEVYLKNPPSELRHRMLGLQDPRTDIRAT